MQIVSVTSYRCFQHLGAKECQLATTLKPINVNDIDCVFKIAPVMRWIMSSSGEDLEVLDIIGVLYLQTSHF